MYKKLTSLFISAITLSSLSLSINHSISMEDKQDIEDKGIDFASCPNNTNSDTFTESTQENSEKSRGLHPKSFEMGHAEAIYFIAVMYRKGQGVLQDLEKARGLYEQAVKLDHAEAMYDLASMYYKGEGVQQNFGKALELFQKAAEGGDTRAMNNLASMYCKGEGVQQNFGKALELLQKAAERGDTLAMYNLALMYQDGKGVQQNFGKALELFQKAAERGHTQAMNNLASMYYRGQGVQQNFGKALELYQKAAEGGDTRAMINLAIMYQDGKGVPKNFGKAVELYQKAAEGGDTRAMYNLACMYHLGQGVPKNFGKAVELYQKAAEGGVTPAMHNLAMIYDLSGEKEKIEKALGLYEQAFFLGDLAAKKSLPKFLFKNKNIPQLIKIEFECTHLLTSCSPEFRAIVMNNENAYIINTTIESLIQKKYKEYLCLFRDVNNNKDHPLKIQKENTPKPTTFLKGSFSFAENDFFCKMPKGVVLYMALNLNPRDLISLNSTSRYFHNILCDRLIDIKIIRDELVHLMDLFMNKLEKDLLKNHMNLKKIIDMLCPTEEKRGQKRKVID